MGITIVQPYDFIVVNVKNLTDESRPDPNELLEGSRPSSTRNLKHAIEIRVLSERRVASQSQATESVSEAALLVVLQVPS